MSDYKPHPLRVQRRRTKGFRLPPVACSVTRPGKWGNPFDTAEEFDRVFSLVRSGMTAGQIGITGQKFAHMARIVRDIDQLRGFKLACFCPIMKDGRYVQCHADILIMYANGLTREQVRDANIRRAERD